MMENLKFNHLTPGTYRANETDIFVEYAAADLFKFFDLEGKVITDYSIPVCVAIAQGNWHQVTDFRKLNRYTTTLTVQYYSESPETAEQEMFALVQAISKYDEFMSATIGETSVESSPNLR